MLGNAYLKKEDPSFKKAINAFNESLKVELTYEAYIGLGRCHEKMKDFQKA